MLLNLRSISKVFALSLWLCFCFAVAVVAHDRDEHETAFDEIIEVQLPGIVRKINSLDVEVRTKGSLEFERLREENAYTKEQKVKFDQRFLDLWLDANSNADSLCEIICSARKGLLEKISNFSQYPVNSGNAHAFEFSVFSAFMSFLDKTKHLCSDQKEQNSYLLWKEKYHQLMGDGLLQKDVGFAQDLKDRLLKGEEPALKITENEQKTWEYLKAFLDKIKSGSTSPLSGVSVYAAQFGARFLQYHTVQESNPDLQKEVYEQSLEFEKNLQQWLRDYKEYEHGYVGSIFGTYGIASSLLALRSIPEKLLNDFDDLTLLSVEKFGDALHIPYSMDSIEFDWTYRVRKATQRDAAARAVPFHLVRYLGHKKGEETGFGFARKDLVAAILNYDEHLPSLLAHAFREMYHKGDDGLAPYYFASTIPYVTAAIKVLENDPSFSPKDQFKLIKEKLEKVLLRLPERAFEKSSIVNPYDWLGHPAYTEPLRLLAMLPLVDGCNGVSYESYGILNYPTTVQDRIFAELKFKSKSSSTDAIPLLESEAEIKKATEAESVLYRSKIEKGGVLR